jgi:RecA/RadA recombinase
MSQLMMKLGGPVAFNNVAMLFVNQYRDNPGVMYGSPIVMPGGHAVPYASSMTIQVGSKPSKDNSGSVDVKVTNKKNRLGVPFREAEFTLNADGTIDIVDEIGRILTNPFYLKRLGVEKSGAWYKLPEDYFGPDTKFQGAQGVADAFRGDEALTEMMVDMIYAKLTRKGGLTK